MVFTDRTVDPTITANSLADLVEKAKEQSEACPLALEQGTKITVEGTVDDRATLLVALVPNGSLTSDLLEHVDQLREYNVFTDIGPIDTGITVNGAPWVDPNEGPRHRLCSNPVRHRGKRGRKLQCLAIGKYDWGGRELALSALRPSPGPLP